VHEGTGRSVVVRINDRGPFHRGRVIDLARGPAQALGITDEGAAYVSLHRLD
jgi:rare lipoprotein A